MSAPLRSAKGTPRPTGIFRGRQPEIMPALSRVSLACQEAQGGHCGHRHRTLDPAPGLQSLDYWGCWAEVFGDYPEGSISSLDYLSAGTEEPEEELFILLKPEHVDQMIKSLYEHIDDLRVMGKSELKKVVEYRDICEANPEYWVAYFIDY